ncbi:calpain-8-like [Rhinophrynus dorsalis]
MAGIAAKIAKDRAVAEGLGTHKNPVKYLSQDFEGLKAQCFASGTLFEDVTFPACPDSVGVNVLGPKSEKAKGIVWKRPMEIQPNPEFIISGATRLDVRQGSLGDCWFLCSIASLTLNEEYLSLVVPDNQSFQSNYAGIFHFKFWRYGEWVDVVVDDRLPTKKGKLIFVKAAAGNEFWSPLLEKAYAKLNGCYEALIAGSPVEALEDFTGGLGELYYLEKPPAGLFEIVQKALKAKALLASSTISDVDEGEKVADNNVIKNHAYSVTGAEEVVFRGGKEKLIRVRNPWGYKEWNGPWSDNAPEWNEIDPAVKVALCTQCDDGEVWMPFADFIKEYYRLDVCNISLSSVCLNREQKWCLTQFNGSWKSGCTAGGCAKYPETFWTNPQFRIKLEKPGNADKKTCTIIVGLMQKDRRKKRPLGEEEFSLGFYLYPISKEFQNRTNVYLGKDFFQKTRYVARNEWYKNHRETSGRFMLPVGEYLIVPHTYYPCQDADFCLRVFSEEKVGAREVGDVVNANLFEPKVSSIPEDTDTEDILNELEQEGNEIDADTLKIVLSKILSKSM